MSALRKASALLCMAAGVCASAAEAGADAADLTADSAYTSLKEVSVVGRKQDPLTELSAYTLVNMAELRRQNIASVKEISGMVPNFYLPDYGSRMTSSIYVRGLGARIDQPVVGLSVDGVSFLNKDNYDFDLFDMTGIEVLRGAQSTLNGRNTMAGQINIVTLSPWQYQGVRLLAEYGRHNSVRAGAGYYTVLSPKLATALTGYFTMTDGYFRNAYTGNRIDTERQGSVRWKMEWRPAENLSVDNVASGQISRQGGYPYENLSTGLIAHNDTCFYHRTSFADGLTVGWRTDNLQLASVTSAQYIDDNMTLDQDFTPMKYFTLAQTRHEWAFTEDLYGKGRVGEFDMLVGVFGFNKRMHMRAPVTFHDDGIANLIEQKPNSMNPAYPIAWDERSFVLGSEFVGTTRGIAVYDLTSWQRGPWLVEMGLRLDIERASLDYASRCNTSYTTYHVLPDGGREVFRHNPLDIDDGGYLHHTYVQLLPKLAAGYTFESGIRVMADVAKGYKAGGFNTQMFSDVLQQRVMEMMGLTKLYDIDDIVSYKPEKSWNFEAGVKMPLSQVDIDATLFYLTCIDQQLTMFPPGLTTGRIMTNAGKTRSFGAEITATCTPVERLTLRGSYGYTNARFVKYDSGRADYAGKRLPYAPANTLFASVNYALQRVGGFTPSANVAVRGVGDIYWDEANLVRQPFYALLSASIALENEHWSFRLWGENLTSTRYDTFYFLSVGNAFVQRARPASYGITLRYTM